MKRLPLIALIAACAAVMIAFDRPLVRGDGLAYLAWLDSFVRDGDADLNNQRERFTAVNTYQIGINYETGRAYNIFPFGVAILQAPFYALGDAFARAGWWDLNPEYFRGMQGVDAPYSLWIMIGANLLALGAVVTAYQIGRRLCDDWTAALAAFVLFVGTPLFYYSTLMPLNSHNAGAFTLAVFVALLWWSDFDAETQRRRENTGKINTKAQRHEGAKAIPDTETQRYVENAGDQWSDLRWLLIGLFAALTVMARWQLATVIVLGYGLLLWRREWRGLLIAGIAGALALLPLPLVWNAMFGSPFVVPYDAASSAGSTGAGAFLGLPIHAPDVLLHTLLHSPVILLSLIGLPFLWQRDRAWALFAGVAIASQVIVNGAALDWWAGDAYGMRRMSELYGVYVLLACAACGKFQRVEDKSGVQLNASTKVRIWGTRAALLLLIPYTALYIVSFVNFTWTNQQGLFSAAPDVMISYFLNQPYNWQIFAEVGAAHFGPAAWSMPGP